MANDSESRIDLELGSWLKEEGKSSEVVISSRIRLARNLSSRPFPNRAQEEALKDIDDEIAEVLLEFGRTGLKRYNLAELNDLEKLTLVEKHLLSRQQSRESGGRSVYLNEEQTISIMSNEEDHLRMQFIAPGEELDTAWQEASSFDDLLDERLDFAFDRKYGYLTACPTNLGTGLRASVMLHLPGLSLAGSIKKLLGSIGKFGLTFRGLYGEGSEAEGSIYQLSNQVTLGRSEEEIIESLESVLGQIKSQEKKTRAEIMAEREAEIKDRIFRALGVLKHAYSLASMESVRLISLLLLGRCYGIIKIEREKLFKLLIKTRPAHLQLLNGGSLPPEERDLKRAEIFRRELAGV